MRRNARSVVPLPEFDDLEAFNAHLLAACQQDDARTVERQFMTIGEASALERPHLLPLPAHDFDCALMVPVTLHAYSQVTYTTNRYTVPVQSAYCPLVLTAHPFHLKILHGA